MEFKIQSADQPERPGRHSSPPDYMSASVRWRLAMLVAALGLVLLAMNKVRNPEIWESLGFGANLKADAVAGEGAEDTASSLMVQEIQLDRSSQLGSDHDKARQVDAAFSEYWYSFFDGLSPKQRNALVVKFAAPTEPIEAVENWVQISRKFLAVYFDDGGDFDEAISNRLRDSQDHWEKFLSADDAAKKFDLSVFREPFAEAVFDAVEDRSAMNRSIESAAWNLSWNRVRDQDQMAARVTYLQIAGQPRAYRGKKVRVVGTALGLEKIDLPAGHVLGIDSYKVLWVKPADANRVPYCVYLAQLPAGFPQANSSYVELDEAVEIEAVFFKLRSYAAANANIEICPLLVADSIEWTPAVSATGFAPSWQPPTWLLISFFVGMPIIAALLAWTVYRSTSSKSTITNRLLPANKTETWDELSNRDDIKSDAEKIDELYSN